MRFIHLERDAVVNGTRSKVEVDFLKTEPKKRKSKKADSSSKSSVPRKRIASGSGKGKGKAAADSDAEASDDDIEEDIARGLAAVLSDDMYASDSDEVEEFDWSHNFREEPKRKKRKSDEDTTTGMRTRTRTFVADPEVIELSD